MILMSPVWLQKHYGFAPAITLQANSIATIMLCIGCLLAGLAADRFGASRTFIVGSLLLAVASWAFYHLSGASPQRLFLLYGTVGLCVGVVGRCLMLWCGPSRRKCASPASPFPTICRTRFWRPDANCRHDADGGVADGPGPVCAGLVADGAGIRYLAASGADGGEVAGRGAAALSRFADDDQPPPCHRAAAED